MKTHIAFAFCILTGTATAAQADCLSEIKAIMDNHLKAGPYRTVMESTFGGATRKSEVEVILPDAFHMKAPEMESIMTKNGMWMKMGGKWSAMPGNMGGMMSDSIKQGIASGMKGMTNAQCLGAQPIEGQSLLKYEMDSSAEVMGVKATSHMIMYANDKGLPQILLVDGTAMGKKSHVVQHITYDPSITIAPPSK